MTSFTADAVAVIFNSSAPLTSFIFPVIAGLLIVAESKVLFSKVCVDFKNVNVSLSVSEGMLTL